VLFKVFGPRRQAEGGGKFEEIVEVEAAPGERVQDENEDQS